MTLQLGPVIGKIGGGTEVTSTPIDGQQTGTSWETVWTADVPAGETWLIAARGTLSTTSQQRTAYLRLTGRDPIETTSTAGAPVDQIVTAEGPTAVSIDLRNINNSHTTAVTGTVYTAPLPD